MAAQEPEPHVLVSWSQYVAAVRGSVSDRYARFYAPLALGMLALAFAPLFDRVVVLDASGAERYRADYGTVFEMAGRPGGGPAQIGVVLLAALVACLTVAAFRVRGPVLPGASAALAAVVALMLITKPGTGSPAPHLTGFGAAGLALALCAVVLGVAHAVHMALLPK
ncbi:hypothetical protein [Dactylosporangium sp. NPDC048998]|uniref:hypothetical protein n=1 Tax=Dactylosporangium sp. NPDC048998 TaxID=3363976 RepID=UPI003710CB35